MSSEFSDYEQLVVATFQTVPAQKLLKTWINMYTEGGLMGDSCCNTAYRVGQCEFVQEVAGIMRKLENHHG